MVQMKRVLLSLLPLLLACTALGSKYDDLPKRQLDMSMEPSNKVKGKGKGPPPGPVMSMNMSMPMPMPMPLPLPMPKGPKSSKTPTKASKAPKKGKKKGEKGVKKGKKGVKNGASHAPSPAGGKPTGPTSAPISPSAPTPITPSPTSANAIPVRATPYALFYQGSFTRIPTNSEYAAVADVTRLYLQEKMVAEFDQTSLTNLDDFLTVMVSNTFNYGQPVQIDYRSTGLFNPSSIFLPTPAEINQLIDGYFTGKGLNEYVARVQALPSSNIFSTTTGVTKGLPNVPLATSAGSTSSSGSFKTGLAAAAAGIVVMAAGAAMWKRKRNNEVLEDPHGDNLKGDSNTLAGETCAASLDGSSVWRKSSPYNKNPDTNETELEDEPLDSDDEKETTPPPRQSRQRGVPPKTAFTT